MIIDTHTHLYVEQFDTDYKEVIQRAMDAGVEKFACFACKKHTLSRCIL